MEKTIEQLEKDMVKDAEHQVFAWTKYAGETFIVKEKRSDYIIATRLTDDYKGEKAKLWKLVPCVETNSFKAYYLKY